MTKPTKEDLQAFLAQWVGVSADADALEPFLENAMKSIARRAGYPNLFGLTQTRIFDWPGPGSGAWGSPKGPGRLLKFDSGLLSLDSLEINGVSAQNGTAFLLYPLNAAADKAPYLWLTFPTATVNNQASIAITGTWGFCFEDEVPADLVQCILRWAAADVLEARREQQALGGVSWSEGDQTERYDLDKIGESMRTRANELVTQFVRPTVFA